MSLRDVHERLVDESDHPRTRRAPGIGDKGLILVTREMMSDAIEVLSWYMTEEKFSTFIFMGNGKDSAKRCGHGHASLDRAYSCLSGMQQTPIDSGEYKEMKSETEKHLHNVAASLGYKITIDEELPYP